MEILATLAYFFLVRLIFFEYKLLRFTLAWKFIVFGLYAGAALTEVILLGQYGPYSKEMIVESYVIQMAPEYGGIVKEVYVEANQPLKKGDPLFQMDPVVWEQRRDDAQASYDLAKDEYDRRRRAGRGAVSALEIDTARDATRAAEADLLEAKYHLDHTTLVAPADGYVVNLVLRPGAFIRLKQPVLTFVSSEAPFLVASVNQRAARFVSEGDEAEVAVSLYPGKVFPAVVDRVIWAGSGVQLVASGTLPRLDSLKGSEYFAVRLRLKDPDPEYPLRFGANGLAAIYTGHGPDVFKLLRQLEIRSESWLNYLYNPF